MRAVEWEIARSGEKYYINKTEYSTIRLSPEKMTIKCTTNLVRSELSDNSRAQACSDEGKGRSNASPPTKTPEFLKAACVEGGG